MYGTANVLDVVSEFERTGAPWTARIRRIVLRPQDDRSIADVNKLVAQQIIDDVMSGSVELNAPDVVMFAVLRYLASGGARQRIGSIDLYVQTA